MWNPEVITIGFVVWLVLSFGVMGLVVLKVKLDDRKMKDKK